MKTQSIGKTMKGAPLAAVFALTALALFAACSLGGNLEDWGNKAYEEKYGKNDSGNHNSGLGVPGNLRVTSATSSSITLAWNSVSGADGYMVERSEYSSGSFELVGGSYTTGYTDNDVYSGATYYYRVCAVVGYSEQGQYSSVVSGTASGGGGGGSLSAPGNLRVTGTTSSSITLAWNTVSGADGYMIQRSEYPSGPFMWAGESYTTSYTDTGVYSGTTYYYQVCAVGSNGNGLYSSIVSGTASGGGGGGSLSAPGNMRVTGTTSSSITLAWNSVSGAEKYTVERSEYSSGPFGWYAESYTTSYTDNSVYSGTTYYYRVYAVGSSGQGQYSSVVSGTASGGGGGGSATPLTNGVWANGNISSTGSATYSFSVTSGTTYYIWWNDAYEGNGTKTLDVVVSVQDSGGYNIFYNADSSWSNPTSFIASSSGTVLITVTPYEHGATGSFGIVYRTTNSRPTP